MIVRSSNRYSLMPLALRGLAGPRQVALIRLATQDARTGANQALPRQASTTPPSTTPTVSEVEQNLRHEPQVRTPQSQVDELPRVVASETNPDPFLYRPIPRPKLMFEPPERPRYDPSKPWYRQELNDDDRIVWGLILSFLSVFPIGYWYYNYRIAWKKEKKEKALKEYLERHPEKQHLADKAAAEAAAKAA